MSATRCITFWGVLCAMMTMPIANGLADELAPLYSTAFATGAEGWVGTGTATISPTGRRPGTGSLLLRQWDDAEQDSAWLSPPIANPGGTVTIGLWAADNYLVCNDFSYSASVDVVDCDAAGTPVRATVGRELLSWDERRRQDHFWGQLLPTGLVWTYHEFTHSTASPAIRLKLNWPKTIVRGDVYLTDVTVTAGPAPVPAAPVEAAAGERPSLTLEISTPVTANLFLTGVPLRFEVLVFGEEKQPPILPEGAGLAWEVTDFEHFAIASGTASFGAAQPLADPSFYESAAGQRRAGNRHAPLILDMPGAPAGRLLFLEVKLVDGARVLAADTVSFGVVSRHRLAAEEFAGGRFSTTHTSRQWTLADAGIEDASLAEKMGIVWTQTWDYHWVQRQPVYPGPFTGFGEPPGVPRLNYLPNLEQIRGRVDDHPHGSVLSMSAKGATLPDPLRPGRTTFDIDAYVAYLVAYTRHHRASIGRVVPSGLERPVDARTVELHKKAYTALKREFPELPVGLMIYGLFQNPSREVDLFFAEELYDYCDFINTHFYAATADWSEWQRLRRRLEKMGRPPLPLISTEFSVVGGADQVERARNMVAGCVDAFAHGMTNIYYYNVNNPQAMATPFLRGPTDLGGTQTSGFMYLQRVDRPRVSPLIRVEEGGRRWAGGSHQTEYPGQSLMPLLATMTHHNLIRDFDTADYRRTVKPSPNAVAHVFGRRAGTVAAIWLTTPAGVETFAVRTAAPFAVRDLFGRTERLTPHAGVALIAVDRNPLTLVFDEAVETLAFEPAETGLRALRVARGGEAELAFRLPAIFGGATSARLSCTVNGSWPSVPDRTLTLAAGEPTPVRMSFPVEAARRAGSHPLMVRLYINEVQTGWMRTELRLEESLRLELEGVPMTVTQGPAVRARIHCLRDAPASGVVRFDDRWFSPGPTPRRRELPYTVAPGAVATVDFPIDRELAGLATPAEVELELRDESGIRLTRRDEVSFRASRRAPGAIAVDGDLADWPLGELTAFPFERELTSLGKPHRGAEDLDAHFHTMWDDRRLYFAVVVRDDTQVSRANDVGIWSDDNLLFGLYPWGWKMDEPTHSGYYREHLGACADGVARVFRIGSVPGGQVTAEGVELAVRREGTTTVYEWAYPAAAVAPLALTAGSRFRLSLAVIDRDLPEPPPGTPWPMGGLQFGGLNLNVLAQPVRWREFTLVP